MERDTVGVPEALVAELKGTPPGRVLRIHLDGEVFCVLRQEDLDHILRSAGMHCEHGAPAAYVWRPKA
jgi:hypothetical protein